MKKPTEAKMTKRKTWRWVTRNPGSYFAFIWLGKRWRAKPELDQDRYWAAWESPAEDFMVCTQQLKSLTGLTVPSDRPIRVSFSAEVLEDEGVTP